MTASGVRAGSAKSVLQPASVAIVGASERAKWPSQIYHESARLRLCRPHRSDQSAAAEGVRPGLPAVAARPARAGRSCHGDRAGRARPRRAGRRRSGRRQIRNRLRRGGRRRRGRGVTRARRLAEELSSRPASCASAARTAWAPIRIARSCSPTPTPSCAACRRDRSAVCFSPAERCSSGSKVPPNGA